MSHEFCSPRQARDIVNAGLDLHVALVKGNAVQQHEVHHQF